MYCQRCGTELSDDAKFCRKCGAVTGTQALSVPAAPSEPPDYENGIKKLMLGLVFLVVAIFPLFSSGRFWWWFLFPAAPLLAAGIAEFVRARQGSRAPTAQLVTSQPIVQRELAPASQTELPRARNTAELVPQPPSITESTTRHLDKERTPRD